MGSAVLSALHGSLPASFAGASQVGWWIIAGCGAAVLLLAIITTGRWARATTERTASLLMPECPGSADELQSRKDLTVQLLRGSLHRGAGTWAVPRGGGGRPAGRAMGRVLGDAAWALSSTRIIALTASRGPEVT
jgi:hypothetical protein